MNIETREEILNNIIEIKNKKTNELIEIKSRKLVFEKSKYSSKNQEIWHVFINDIKMNKKSEILVTYKCSSCESHITVGTTQYLRKIRGCKASCSNCNLLIHNSKPEHNKKNPKNIKTIERLNAYEYYEKSISEFEDYPEEFKVNYFKKHLTEEDYNRIKNNIVSFENGKYTDIDNIKFCSIYRVNNQMHFSSMLIDTNGNIFKANQPLMRCCNCDNIWRAKSIDRFKNQYKIFCKECSLVNNTFKIRPIKNINNKIITYQSKLELKFVEWCNSNNYCVENGPDVEYYFMDKLRKYKVDFKINNILIEIKDYHIWHKQQVECGKWQAKLDAVEKYIIENNGTYFFITPNNWVQKIKELQILLNKI